MAILLPLFYFSNLFRIEYTAQSDLWGSVISANDWNNWGINVNLRSSGKNIGHIDTSLNGSFFFKDIGIGNEELLFIKDNTQIAKRRIDSRNHIPVRIVIPKRDSQNHVDVINMVLNLFLLGLILYLIVTNKDKSLVLSFFWLLLTPIIYNFTEFIQILLATFGHEYLAGSISPIKIIGLTFFGPAFYSFFNNIYFKQTHSSYSILNKTVMKVVVICEAAILLSWLVFANDQIFIEFWKFSFARFRDLLLLQTVVFMGMSILKLIRIIGNEKNPELKNRVKLIFFSVLLVTIILLLFIFLPLIMFNIEIIPFTFVLFLVTIIFLVTFLYAINNYQFPYVGFVISKSIVMGVFSALYIIIYSLLIIFIESRIGSLARPWLEKSLLFILLIIILPLINITSKIVERFLFRQLYEQEQEITKMGRKILGMIRTKDVVEEVEKGLHQLLNAEYVKMKVFKAKRVNKTADAISLDHLRLNIIYNQDLLGVIEVGNPLLELDTVIIAKLSSFQSEIAIALHNCRLHETMLEMNEKMLSSQRNLDKHNRLSSIGNMAAGIAHEIKNPISVVGNLIAVLPTKIEDREFMSNFLEMVPRQIKRVDDLVKELLNYSKEKTLVKERYDFSESIKDALNLVRSTAKKKHIVIESNVVQTYIIGDKNALEQVFINLLLNSIDALPETGVIKIEVVETRSEVIITFSDNGVGIAKKNLNKIFDPFYTTKDQGTGLGLSTVYKIIDNHNGSIKVSSIIGEGTEFVIKLPVA